MAHLEKHSNVPQDQILVTQIKMQLVVNQVRSSLRSGPTVAIPPLYVSALRSQLEDILGAGRGDDLSAEVDREQYESCP